MTIEFWLGISAGATFLLALAAFWSIWQNYSFRKEERAFRVKTAALDNIHEWLMDVLNTITQYLVAVRERDEKRKFVQQVQCHAVVIRGGDMLVAAGIFGEELMNKVEQVHDASEAYYDALNGVLPEQTEIQDEIVKRYAKALGDAFTTLSKKRMEILPEYFKK